MKDEIRAQIAARIDKAVMDAIALGRAQERREVIEYVQQIVTDTAQQWDDGEGSRTFNACMAIQDKLLEMAKEGGKDG